MNLLSYLEKRSSLFWALIGLIGIATIGIVDILTGWEIALSVFYLIPIVLVTWFSGRNAGLLISIAGAAMWFIADELVGPEYSEPMIRFWNTGVRLGFFVVVTLLLPALKELNREKDLARLDYLTGIPNRRHFFEVIQKEIKQSARSKQPLAVAYLDIDDFKAVNDKWGHLIGDQLLCVVARQIKRHIRETDFLARLGGDEFVMLFPKADENASEIAVSKIQSALKDEMLHHEWPVTFSIGVLTCLGVCINSDELIKRADDLMYSVKKNGKNGIAFGIIPNDSRL